MLCSSTVVFTRLVQINSALLRHLPLWKSKFANTVVYKLRCIVDVYGVICESLVC